MADNSVRERLPELYGIQLLRGVAAVSVVCHHAAETASGEGAVHVADWVIASGAAGVDIFFVISGFIMIYTSFRIGEAPISIGEFLFRRLSRIFPLYWLFCAVQLILIATGLKESFGARNIILSIFLLPSDGALLQVSWTLVYEFLFYLLFAITLLLGSPVKSLFAMTFCFSAIVLFGKDVPYLQDPLLFEFSMGMALGCAFLSLRSKGRVWPRAWFLGGFAALVLFFVTSLVPLETTGGLTGWTRPIAWGLPSVVLVASVLWVKTPTTLIGRGALLLGSSSYAIYLVHVFVIRLYRKAVHYPILEPIAAGIHPGALLGLVILSATIAGVFVHLLVERPLARFIRPRSKTHPNVFTTSTS